MNLISQSVSVVPKQGRVSVTPLPPTVHAAHHRRRQRDAPDHPRYDPGAVRVHRPQAGAMVGGAARG